MHFLTYFLNITLTLEALKGGGGGGGGGGSFGTTVPCL